MARVKIQIPEKFSFQTVIPIRISDINYGNHVGNDAVLSLMHEARLQWLSKYGYTELNIEGNGLIMADAAIEFKKEMFYAESITIQIAIANFSSIGFELYYQFEKSVNHQQVVTVVAKTGMICYDYSLKKIAALPPSLKEKLTAIN